ncbi:hypothetical protein MMC18_000547 [Xylographa bjoerkii]|nr:hypothetical protein [Xylographa bjoerkii]
MLQHYPVTRGRILPLRDVLLDQRLQSSELTSFRASLAYRMAAFVLSTLDMDMTLSSRFIVFHSEQTTNINGVEQLAANLTNPYLCNIRQSLHSTSTSASWHGLTRTESSKQERVQKLGILLFEIGAWEKSSGETVSEVLENARSKANKAREAMSRSYYRAMQECLDWVENTSVQTFVQEILTPLQILSRKLALPNREVL